MFCSVVEPKTFIVRISIHPEVGSCVTWKVLTMLLLDSSLGGVSYLDKDYYKEFQKKTYQVAYDIDQLNALNTKDKALGYVT